jgi:hypothetical protein
MRRGTKLDAVPQFIEAQIVEAQHFRVIQRPGINLARGYLKFGIAIQALEDSKSPRFSGILHIESGSFEPPTFTVRALGDIFHDLISVRPLSPLIARASKGKVPLLTVGPKL